MAKMNNKSGKLSKISALQEVDNDLIDPKHPHLQSLSPATTREGALNHEETEKKVSKIREITQDKTVFINLICMMTVWLSASFNYYLIGYQLKYIEGNLYINGIVSSLSECAAFLLSGILIEKIGIKPTLVISYVVAIAGMGALILVDPETTSQFLVCLFILGSKFGVS